MYRSTATYLKEFVRCTRHNLLHLHTFRMTYRRGMWHVTDGQIKLDFPKYPYLAFHDIEGYLNEGRFKPQPGMTVIDAGGCYGEYALYAAGCVGPGGRVLMLEPDPANIAAAREFFQLNGNPGNIEIVPAGLWSRPGKLQFRAGQGEQSTIVFNSNNKASDASAPAADTEGTIEIEVHSLASLAEAYDLERMDMVKMDIEGAEVEVISTADQLAPRYKPCYAIASYHVVNGQRTADTMAQMFPKMGYHVRSGYPQHLTTWASPTPFE
jgi:FkbM family methyltransferase